MTTPELLTVSRIRQIIRLIDLTNLNDDCDRAAIETLCHKAVTPAGDVAALCVWPRFVLDAKNTLGSNSPIKIATVVNFPTGSDALKTTESLINNALKDGADEIDYVLPYSALLNDDINRAVGELAVVRKQIPSQRTLKIILETGMLKQKELIRVAADIAIDQGADFIKTSTGKVPINATEESAAVMLEAIANSKKDVGFKAAGGIKTVEDANLYLNLAEKQFGSSWVNAAHFRFGASGLLQDALAKLDLASSSDDENGY